MLQSDPLAALQLEVDLDLAQLVAAVVAATAVEDSFDSFPSPSASSTYSLPTAIQEDEHKDPSLLHSLQVVVVVLNSDCQKHYLEKQNQNQDHKLELHKLQSLSVDQTKEVLVDLELFLNPLQNSSVESGFLQILRQKS